MMTIPPMILTHGLLMIAEPTRPAVVPSRRKITESPALKASEFKITARRLPVPSFRLSMTDAGDLRNVTRHERQHAGRKKREYARYKSDN